MKKIILIHAWGSNPNNEWYPWLKEQLPDYEIIIPEMPDTETPTIDKWLGMLNTIANVDEETIMIGHSIGCQTIIRWLATTNKKVKAAIFVAGWFTLKGLEDEELAIAQEWLATPIDDKLVKEHVSNIAALFSDDDPYVGSENKALFEDRLGAETISVGNKGHMTAEEGHTKLPELLEVIKQL